MSLMFKEYARPFEGITGKIVCLCGSTRHKDRFIAAAKTLSLQGNVVLGPQIFSQTDGDELTAEDIETLVEVHNRKIQMADVVVIINADGIGKSTENELLLALLERKEIVYTHKKIHVD